MKVRQWLCSAGTALAMSAVGCGQAGVKDLPPPRTDVPAVVMPTAGEAVVAGRVIELDGQPVPHALVVSAEPGGMVLTDALGVYAIAVPAESTVTLQASAPGFATTHVAAVQVPAGQTAAGKDIRLVTPAKLAELNHGTRMMGEGLGVVAIELRSKNGGCTTEGGRVALTPASIGAILYNEPNSLDPDPTLAVAEASNGISAWVVGALPAGAAATLVAEKPGCAPVRFPVDLGERVETGKFRIAAGALTQITLYLD
jgi:Carboxypeptidase regulatory-like domain